MFAVPWTCLVGRDGGLTYHSSATAHLRQTGALGRLLQGALSLVVGSSDDAWDGSMPKGTWPVSS